MKTAPLLLLLCLILSLLEVVVYSQTEYPYISFMGMNLPKNSYVDLTTVGDDTSDTGNTVVCHTDLETCCSSNQGIHRGAWFFPDGTGVPAPNPFNDFIIGREPQEFHIRRRNNAMSPTGIYFCEIETIAVHDDNVNTVTGETVYVGLYLPNEGC